MFLYTVYKLSKEKKLNDHQRNLNMFLLKFPKVLLEVKSLKHKAFTTHDSMSVDMPFCVSYLGKLGSQSYVLRKVLYY